MFKLIAFAAAAFVSLLNPPFPVQAEEAGYTENQCQYSEWENGYGWMCGNCDAGPGPSCYVAYCHDYSGTGIYWCLDSNGNRWSESF